MRSRLEKARKMHTIFGPFKLLSGSIAPAVPNGGLLTEEYASDGKARANCERPACSNEPTPNDGQFPSSVFPSWLNITLIDPVLPSSLFSSPHFGVRLSL